MFFRDAEQRIKVLTPTVLSPLLFGSLFGYLLGSIPSAFLLVRWKSRLDIREAGSGNVGTLNSYQVTGSRIVGIFVLVFDLLKGFVAAAVTSFLFGGSFSAIAGAGIGSVVGHNFPVWLRFKGGRGLATAAGVFLFLSPVCVAAWAVCWGVGFAIVRKVNLANIGATIALLILVWLLPGDLLPEVIEGAGSVTGIRLFVTCILGVILAGHYKPLKEFFSESRTRS